MSRPELQKRRGRDAFGGRDLMLWKEISEKSRLAIFDDRRLPAPRPPPRERLRIVSVVAAFLSCSSVSLMLSLSEYERERAENIKRNQEVLRSLGLIGPDRPVPMAASLATKPSSRPKRAPPPPREPTRRSSRNSGAPAPDYYIAEESANGRVITGGTHAQLTMLPHVSASEQPAAEPEDEDYTPETESDLHPNEREVYAALREEKNLIARELDCPAYHVCQNRALMAMARRVPSNRRELLDCWGWGESKVSSFGDRLLDALKPHAAGLLAAKDARRDAKIAIKVDEDDEMEEVPLPLRKKLRSSGATASEVAAAVRATAVPAIAMEAPKAEEDDEVLEAEEDEDEDEDGGKARARPPLPEGIDDLFPFEMEAFQALLEWKRARARELGYNDPCIICHNKTLCQLVRLTPNTRAALRHVWGIGPKRIVQHGDLMLAALAPFRAALRARRPPEPTPIAEPTARNASNAKVEPPLRAQRADAERDPQTAARATDDEKPPKTARAVTDEKPRRPGGVAGGAWREDAGASLASRQWSEGAEEHGWPSTDWALRRHWCATANGCAACAGFVADGEAFKWAVMSQKVLDVLSSSGAYGSHAAAHAAGWRWLATPNGPHPQRSHCHQWWPPQAVIDDYLEGAKLPLGTYAAMGVLERMF